MDTETKKAIDDIGIELLELFSKSMKVLPELLRALPRCEDCDQPATRIGPDEGERDAGVSGVPLCLCDGCRPEQRLCEIEEAIDGMSEPEVRWAAALRELKQAAEGEVEK